MKKHFFSVLAAAAVLVCSCSDDALNGRIDSLEARIAALEEKVQSNADAIAKLFTASQSSVTINSVVKTDDGYVITFSDGTVATLSDGKDGEAGKTPVIGVKDVDGVLCWTVNGEVLMNEGSPVPVTGENGVTPKFKVENGKWYVSYNGGESWDEAGDAVTEVSSKVTVEETDTAWIFTIDEKQVSIPKTGAFAIKIETEEAELVPGVTVTLQYTVTGTDETVHVVAESPFYKTKVDEEACTVAVAIPSPLVKGYVIVKAIRNSDGANSAQYIAFIIPDEDYGAHGGYIQVSDDDRYINW